MDLSTLCNKASQPLEAASSLPFEVYSDPAILVEEARQIFHKEWVFVCMAPELPNPGDYFALHLAGEPIAIVRGDDGELRALSNVCRHRGTRLLDNGLGSVDKYIVCPYHAWAFSKQGELKAVPHNKVIAVDADSHALPEFKLAVWHGLVFVNLDVEASPLESRLGDIDRYLQAYEPETFSAVSQGEIETWTTNWKLAMENAMESYHLFKVHEQTLEVFSPTRDAYYIAGSSEWSLTGGLTQRKKGLLEKMFSEEIHDHYVLVSLPPSFVGVLSYGSFGWLSAHPISEDETMIRSGSISLPSMAKYNQGSDDFTKAFFAEDKEICERVHQGMRAQFGRGRKLTDMERVVVDFHQFWATRLGSTSPTEFFEECEQAARFVK